MTQSVVDTTQSWPRYSEPTFRMYEPEFSIGPYGSHMIIQVCEEFVGGKWEGFVSVKTPQALRRSRGK